MRQPLASYCMSQSHLVERPSNYCIQPCLSTSLLRLGTHTRGHRWCWDLSYRRILRTEKSTRFSPLYGLPS